MVMAIAFALGVLVADAGKFDLGYELKVRQAYDQAYRTGAEAMEVLRIVDQDGKPVAEANIRGALQTGGGIWDYSEVVGATDTNGVFAVKGKCKNFLHCSILKDGYYISTFDREYYNRRVYPPVVDGKWQPYGQLSEVKLWKIVNPVKLEASQGRKYYPYVRDKEWVGFDLEKRDWVSPYGKGLQCDVMIKIIRANRNVATMDVSFANNPCAGAYLVNCKTDLDFKMVYEANPEEIFKSELSYSYAHDKMSGAHQSMLTGDQFLVFRTRTKVDVNGRLQSAHYGIIVGDWRFMEKGGMSMAGILFNSTPNDTNLEDAENARQSRLRYRQIMECNKWR